MKTTAFKFVAIFMFFFPVVAVGGNKSLVYTGHITEPGGAVLNAGNVTFTFSIYAPNGAHGNDCLLYRETQVVDMTNKQGTFSVRIGEGTRIAGYLQADLERVFQNTGTFPGLTCSSGSGNFQPAADAHRELGVSFLHNAVTVALDRKVISSVPFASAVTGTANVNSFAIRNTTNNGQVALAAPTGAFANYALTFPNALPAAVSLMKVSATGVISFETLPTCGASDFLKADGTNISCVTPTAGSGTVTSITAGTGLTGGAITGAGTIGLGPELAALNGVATTGFLQRTGAGAYSTVSTATMANTILPDQTGNSGEFLTTDGTNVTWSAIPAAGITALTGEVTASGSGSVAATIANSAVTYAKIQNAGANSLLGNPTGASAAVSEITLGSGLQFNAGTLRTINSATASGGNNTLVMRGAAGEVQSYSFDVAGSTSGFASIRAPTTFTNYVLTLPSDDGDANQVLQTNGSGVLSWVNQPTGVFTPGTDNTFVGLNAGDDATVNAIGNTGVGRNALTALTGTAAGDEGDYNSAFGNGALSSATTAGANVAVGTDALAALQTNIANVAVGAGALAQMTTGGANTALGHRAGYRATTNSARNVFVGWNAGPTGDTDVYDALYIHNDGSDYPLVGGNFSTRVLQSHGDFEVRPTTDSAAARQLRLYEGGASWSNRVSIQAPALGADYTLTLPINDGDANQVLQTDGAGVLSWVTPAAGGVTSLTGTANQISVSAATGAVTLSTPQNIHAAATPTFAGMTLSGLSAAGFVKNDASGVLSTAANVNLASEVTGTLPVANGGTGATTFTANQVLIGNGTSAITSTATLPNAVMDNITRLGTVTTGTWNGTAIGPTYGGTGQTAVSTGDLLYGSGANTWARLPAGTNGHVLTLSGGVPSWSAPAAGANIDIDGATPFETSVGFEAGNAVAAGGLHNTFFGYQAGRLVSTGDSNVAIGSGAMPVATNSANNISIGHRSLEANTSSTGNVAIGSEALLVLEHASEDSNNLAIGTRAAAAMTHGQQNIAIGHSSLGGLESPPTVVGRTVAVGYQALGKYTGGNPYIGNDAVGYSAMINLTTGSQNAAFGSTALTAITTGNMNTGLGQEVGQNLATTSSQNILIGFQAGPSTPATTTNQKLYIDVQASNTPLIYGDFYADQVKINGSLATGSAVDATALSGTVTPNFTAANMIRSVQAGLCSGTVDFRTDNSGGIVEGGSYTFTLVNATSLCNITFNGSATNLKIPSDYVAGTTVSGVVYTAIYDGLTLWVSYVPF